MASKQKRFRIIMPVLQFLVGAVATFFLLVGLMNELDSLILTTALAGAFINLFISTLSARRDLYAGLYAAVAFGGAALLLSLLSLGDVIMSANARPLLFWLLVAIVAVMPGMAGVWGVFMLARR